MTRPWFGRRNAKGSVFGTAGFVAQAREVIKKWCHEFYNTRRRHSSAAFLSPAAFEKITADQPAAA